MCVISNKLTKIANVNETCNSKVAATTTYLQIKGPFRDGLTFVSLLVKGDTSTPPGYENKMNLK